MGGAYGETPPAPALGGRVACLWWLTPAVAGERPAPGPESRTAGTEPPGDRAVSGAGGPVVGAPPGHAILPDGSVDLVWHAERLTVAGPDTRARRAAGGGTAVGVRLRPGAATTFGTSASALRDRQPTAEELWGAAGRRLTEQVADAQGPRARLDVLAQAVSRLAAAAPPPDPLVTAAVAALDPGRSGPAPDAGTTVVGETPRMAAVAAHVGLSDRQLRRRFLEHVGYGPKTLDRVLRLQRFLALSITTDHSLAGLAARAGYADQAHLAREARALADATPAELVATRRSSPDR